MNGTDKPEEDMWLGWKYADAVFNKIGAAGSKHTASGLYWLIAHRRLVRGDEIGLAISIEDLDELRGMIYEELKNQFED